MSKARELAELGDTITVDGSGNATFDGDVSATSFTGDGSSLTGIVSIPSGVITLWSGSTASIPSGWVLCDGNNSTPDLRDRFVVGAGSTYAVDATGGSNTVALSTAEMPSHTHSVSGNTSSSGNHTHNGSTSNTGSHSHNLARGSGGGGTGYVNINFDAANQNQQSGLVGSAGSHSHNFTTAGGGDHSHSFSTTSGSAGSGTAHENRPPYYALAYIMKT